MLVSAPLLVVAILDKLVQEIKATNVPTLQRPNIGLYLFFDFGDTCN